MRRQLAPALRMLLVLTVLTGLVYPLAMTGIAQALFDDKANGSIVEVNGKAVGSSLLGQEFTGATYFHSRPSSAGAGASGSMVTADGSADPAPADVADLAIDNSGSSNLGPTNPDLIAAVTQRATDYRAENGLPPTAKVPIDAVTSSGSGVDPGISVANARIQATRVAKARGIPLATVLALVKEHTDSRSLGFLGEPAVNVLKLNLALDAAR